MVKPMKLKGRIRFETDRTLVFYGQLYDRTPFSLRVDQFDVEMNEPFLPSKMTVDGWLFVQQESRQDTRVYITLPKPTIQFGHHILVHHLELMPLNATIDDFMSKKLP